MCNKSLLEEGIYEVEPLTGRATHHRIRPEGVRGSLHSAAASGNVPELQRLLAGGAAVNRSTGGVAPLHMAAHNGGLACQALALLIYVNFQFSFNHF